MPKTIIAGNWKMHKTRAEARTLAQALLDGIKGEHHLPEIVLFPPFTCLQDVLAVTLDSPIGVGAQNMDYRASGAFTGEISPVMLVDLAIQYVIIGHSERRQLFAETDTSVNLKLKSALEYRLIPIVCVGESAEEHGAELTDSVIRRQVAAALADLTRDQIAPLLIAYEPLWAIGAGKSCPVKEANRVAALIRATINDLFGAKGESGADNVVGEKIPILYGGSVNASTIEDQLNEPDINGVLVGGASLSAEEFLPLVMSGGLSAGLALVP